MCQFFMKHKGRKCGNKKEPYCHLHSHIVSTDTINESKPIDIVVSKNINLECPICYEEYTFDKVIHTSCKHPICKNCLIKSGSTICCICRKNIESDIDKDTIELISFIKSKDSKIDKLDSEINTLRTIFTLLGF